jgi:molecular chaperone DnaK
MKEEARLHAQEDKEMKHKVVKKNQAEILIQETENLLKTEEKSLSTDKKKAIEHALEELKLTYRGDYFTDMIEAMEELKSICKIVGEELIRDKD